MRHHTLLPYGVLLICLLCLLVGRQFGRCNARTRLYTASNQITALAVSPSGTIWAATGGGLLCWQRAEDVPQLRTTAEGLAGNELRALACGTGTVAVANAVTVQMVGEDGGIVALSDLLKGQEIRCLCAGPGGYWIGSSEGLYRLAGTQLTKQCEGSLRRVATDGTLVWAVTDQQLIRLPDGRRWALPNTDGNITALAVAGDAVYLATAAGCWRWQQDTWHEIALPATAGSHVSAISATGQAVSAAIYGDGLYTLQGEQWRRLPQQPRELQYVTALLSYDGGLLAGTRQVGLWRCKDDTWRQLRMPPALPSADIYGLAVYRGALWASTFDQGVLCLRGESVQRITRAEGLSTNSPRGLLVFQDRLYVRHTTGEVDCFDGKSWRVAFPKPALPRQGVYSLATDGRRLYLGVWAGWAATDGKSWEYHFHDTQLQGQVVTAIAAGGDTVWVGTQRQGIFAYAPGVITQYHEAHGLTDDWITCIATSNGRVLVGTYTGGLLEWNGTTFTPLFTPQGFAIRDIAFSGTTPIVATPLGVYRDAPAGWTLLNPSQYGGLETQTLCRDGNGLWIGSRTALAYLSFGD